WSTTHLPGASPLPAPGPYANIPWHQPGWKQLTEGKVFEAQGAANKVKLAWENSVAKNMGASIGETGLNTLVANTPGLRNLDSLQAAIRADGTLDPTSWWSKGPQLAMQVPGTASGIYDSVTGE
ncbi:hypothetical protein AB0I98_45135, partial [Streptomyces sp. NPDC050211]